MPRFETLNEQQLEIVSRNQVAQQRSWRETPPEGHVVECCGKPFLVLPNVFPPKSDTQLLIDNMGFEHGTLALDMGTGTGVLAVFAVLKGARSVVAADINPDAVRNAELNAERFDMQALIKPRLSDGFSAFADSEKFDVILANLPGRSETAADVVEAAQWDSEFRLHKSFFEEAPAHLRSNGRILMTKANYPELNAVVDLAERLGFEGSVLAKKAPAEHDPRTYYALAFAL